MRDRSNRAGRERRRTSGTQLAGPRRADQSGCVEVVVSSGDEQLAVQLGVGASGI